jgi:hypothetical protein
MVLCKSASTSLCVLHLLSPLPPVPSRLASAIEKLSRGAGQRGEVNGANPASCMCRPLHSSLSRRAPRYAAPLWLLPTGVALLDGQQHGSATRAPPPLFFVLPPRISDDAYPLPYPPELPSSCRNRSPCSAIESSSAAAESTSDARRRAARASEQLLRTVVPSSCQAPPPRLQAPRTSRCAQARAHARCIERLGPTVAPGGPDPFLLCRPSPAAGLCL